MASNAPRAGGCLLALAVLAGTLIGILYRQPSIGFVAGLGVGSLMIVIVWLLERRRQ